jgi:hypothetical protein
MPLIQVRVIKDVFSKERKREIISKLTDAMVHGRATRQRCLIGDVLWSCARRSTGRIQQYGGGR